MWLSLVERCVRDAEAAGSNPVISTIKNLMKSMVSSGFLFVNNTLFVSMLHLKYIFKDKPFMACKPYRVNNRKQLHLPKKLKFYFF